MSPDQRQQVRQILIADRGAMRDTLKQLRAAHEALADELFAVGPLTDADVQPQVQKIAALHQQLVEHGTQVMLKVRTVATPDQLAKAAATKQKVDQLRDQIRALLGEPAGGDDDLPPPE
jgi:Spy/CpxP family protein refolding chaperone